MSNHSIESKIQIYCNIFTPTSYSTVKGYIRDIWQTGWDPRDSFQVPSLITCPIPKRLDHAENMQVSITRKRCRDVEVSMKVIMNPQNLGPEGKKDVAVCVKGLDYQVNKIWVECILWFLKRFFASSNYLV